VKTKSAARSTWALSPVWAGVKLALQSFVSKLERRERRIDPVEFYDWARASGIDSTALFGGLAERLGSVTR
jgi:hypothetical protein